MNKKSEKKHKKTFFSRFRVYIMNMENKDLHDNNFKTFPRRWFPLKTLDWYILREFLIKYSVLLLVFVILFVLNNVYSDISGFLESRASMRSFCLYLLYRLPGNIRFILPISMLLGCMWTMAIFGKNLEITAMRANGLSLIRCGVPILFVGLIVTGINIYFNEALVPYAEHQAERILSNDAHRTRFVESYLAYNSTDQRRRWFFKTFQGSDTQKEVTIKTAWTPAMVEYLLADAGTPEFKAFLKELCPEKVEKLSSASPDELRQELRKELVGRKVDLTIGTAVYENEARQWRFKDGNFVSYDRSNSTRYRASSGIYSIHAPVKFNEWVFPETEIPESPFDIVNAVKEKDDLPTVVIWELVSRNPGLAQKLKDIYMTVFWYRIAFPWACFLAVFLGIPLATKNERTGSLMAIITAVCLIVVYIVVAQVFLVLGKNGTLWPWFAGLAPTIGFIAAGAFRILRDKN